MIYGKKSFSTWKALKLFHLCPWIFVSNHNIEIILNIASTSLHPPGDQTWMESVQTPNTGIVKTPPITTNGWMQYYENNHRMLVYDATKITRNFSILFYGISMQCKFNLVCNTRFAFLELLMELIETVSYVY